MAKHVFISHAAADKAMAQKVCGALEAEGIRCWMAPRDVAPGATYGAALIDAINAAAVLVLVLSSASNESPQVIREVERAGSRGIPIIPFCIEEVVLSKDLEFFISTHHWLDASGGSLDGHLQRLCEAVASFEREEEEGEDLGEDDDLSTMSAALAAIRTASSTFFSADVKGRIAAARKIRRLASVVDLPSLLRLCTSTDRGERVAGFVGLSVHLATELPEANVGKLVRTLAVGLTDKESRVRYRAVEAAASDLSVAGRLISSLQAIEARDTNPYVREAARDVLRRIA